MNAPTRVLRAAILVIGVTLAMRSASLLAAVGGLDRSQSTPGTPLTNQTGLHAASETHKPAAPNATSAVSASANSAALSARSAQFTTAPGRLDGPAHAAAAQMPSSPAASPIPGSASAQSDFPPRDGSVIAGTSVQSGPVPTQSSVPGAVPSQQPQSERPEPLGSSTELPASGSKDVSRNLSDDRERQLAEREAVAAATEKRLSDRVAELAALQTRLEALQSALKERDQANWAGLVKLYEGMRPRDAAAIFNALDKKVLLELLDRMKPGKAGPILASMEPERARQITADLAAKRTQSTNVEN